MKHDNRKRNRLIACLMCAVLVGSALYCMPSVFATTVESELTDTKAYSEWKNIKPENGNFEAGYAGKEVYGWHKTAIEVSGNKKTVNTVDENGTSNNRIESFLNAYVLTTTVEEDGNKVALLQKKGSGYVGVTSQETEVVGGETYRLSFDYKLMELGGTGDYYGVRLLVEELDADMETVLVGEKQLYQYYGPESAVSEEDIPTLETKIEASIEFQPSEDTKYIIIYLWFGAGGGRTATVYFDNVMLGTYEDLNGTFDDVTYIGDGGREGGEMGPAGWTGVSCTQGGTPSTSVDASGYESNYIATVATESENNYLCHSLDKAANVTSGYSLIQSPYIALAAGEQFSLQYDMKAVLESGTPSHKTRVAFWYYNANKERIDTSYHRGDEMSIGNMEWTTLNTATYTAPENTAYVKIGFLAAQERGTAVKFQLCYDNVIFKVNDTDLTTNWIGQASYDNGKPRSDHDYSQYYGLRTVNEGAKHSEALQLYVTREAGILGGATFYSKPMTVEAGQSYTTSFDLKIENNFDYYYTNDNVRYYTDETTYIDTDGNTQSTTTTNLFGASYVLRFKNAEGTVLNMDGSENTNSTPSQTSVYRVLDNQDWRSYEYLFTAPKNALTVEVGLIIGGSVMNTDTDLMYTWDNIVLMETEDYEKYSTDNDLLFKLTERGNAYNSDTNVDVLDLVMMKKYAAGTETITTDILNVADMNVNTLINNADIELLHWKLLGITTEDQAALVQGYDFYQ